MLSVFVYIYFSLPACTSVQHLCSADIENQSSTFQLERCCTIHPMLFESFISTLPFHFATSFPHISNSQQHFHTLPVCSGNLVRVEEKCRIASTQTQQNRVEYVFNALFIHGARSIRINRHKTCSTAKSVNIIIMQNTDSTTFPTTSTHRGIAKGAERKLWKWANTKKITLICSDTHPVVFTFSVMCDSGYRFGADMAPWKLDCSREGAEVRRRRA